MSRLTDLLKRTKDIDAELGRELEKEFKALSDRRAFGLNFERCKPEMIELPGRDIRQGDKVWILPPRGSTKKPETTRWFVKKIEKAKGKAHLTRQTNDDVEKKTVSLDDVRVIADIHDTIYPGLVSTGKVEQGSDKPFHTVINGENFHALEALTFTHRHKIDAIYIDPPYNSGAKDWKYNNHYVDKDDSYRHSKWLAMMERRLLVAKQLLNPEKSVLIVTIDEKEYLRLGLLLEQLFPEATQQMVSSIINPAGTPKKNLFSRVDEYLFFIFFGNTKPAKTKFRMMERDGHISHTKPVRWASLLRSGGQSLREDTKEKFYPIFLDKISKKITKIGDNVSLDFDICSVSAEKNEDILWPLKPGGVHGCWQVSDKTLREYVKNGRVRRGEVSKKTGQLTLYFLMSSDWERIQNGSIEVLGYDDFGGMKLGKGQKLLHGKTVWNLTSHSSTDYGPKIVKSLINNRKFPYPKSLYAVEDTLRFFVADNPDAIILDFFAGSGTTAHAVMRLNRQDGGRRQSISITNNEVSDTEAKALTKQKYRQGDAEWEKWGICDYITKPRIKAAITGTTPEGKAIAGDYKFTDEFPMAEGFDENAEFFDLTYESPLAVDHNLAFERIAPLLWIRAGSTGRRIEVEPPQGWDVADTYGLLTNLDKAKAFCEAISLNSDIRIAYIVTDDDRCFQSVAQDLPPDIEKIRLYESYLTNFQFAHGG